MTALLELREKCKLIYSRNETYILPLVKFFVALITLACLNGRMGYMAQVDNFALVMMVSLACSFLPAGFITLSAAAFSLLHMYALSWEVLAVGGCIYLALYLAVFRMGPGNMILVALTPVMMALGVPYVLPIAVGLVAGPSSVVSLSCGAVAYYVLKTVTENASAIALLEPSAMTEKLTLLLDALMQNTEMLIMVVVFAATALVVCFVKKLPVDYAWTIAMVAGAVVNIVMLLVADFVYNIQISVFGVIGGCLLGVVVGKVIEFFRFCVDYSRTERVQFEDDEYYYYVKAIPKMTVAVRSRTVKKIHTQSGSGAAVGAKEQPRTPKPQGRPSQGRPAQPRPVQKRPVQPRPTQAHPVQMTEEVSYDTQVIGATAYASQNFETQILDPAAYQTAENPVYEAQSYQPEETLAYEAQSYQPEEAPAGELNAYYEGTDDDLEFYDLNSTEN